MRSALLIALTVFTLGACGDGDVAEQPAAPEPRAAAAPLVAALGDSITEGTPYGNDASWTAVVAARDGVEVRNCGVNGERTDEIAGRLDACVKGASSLIVQGGINDIAQGRPVELAASDLEQMVRRGKAKRLPVAIVEVLPWLNGYPGAASAIAQLNRRIAAIARAEDAELIRWGAVLEDPDRPGAMRADRTEDGNHPDRRGYELLAAKVKIPSAR